MIFVSGLGAPETPRLHPVVKDWYCVEIAPHRGGVTRISRDGGVVELVARTGTPNGLVFDQEGVIWVAETVPPGLLRLAPGEDPAVYMDAVEGQAMLLPNDLCFGPDGLLYMTDSGILMSDWVEDGAPRRDFQTASYDGRVYQIDLGARTGRILDSGIRFANGIAFGPDGHLYANEMISGDIFRYPFVDGRPSGERMRFSNVMSADWPGGFRGPDGMAFGADGRLHCTVYGQGEVAVVDPDGSISERIATEGRNPTNVAWGADGEQRLYVSEHQLGQMEAFASGTTALPLYYGGPDRLAV
jgi:gluconolactonase